MAIVQVALLRKVLDNGPEGNLYYEASLGLIITALILEIIAGIISIFAGNLSSYHSKHGGNGLKDCCANICCCKIVSKKGKHKKKTFGLWYSGRGGDRETLDPKDDDDEFTGAGCSPCCPCECSTEVLEGHELQTVEKYEDWERQQMKLSLQNEAARLEREQLVKLIEDARKQLSDLESSSSTDTAEVKEQAEEIQKTIDEAMKKKEDYELTMLDKTILDAQGEILKEKVKNIRKSHVYKTATFWMHVLQWILYIIFILQAFIAGLTVIDQQTGNGTETTTTTMSTVLTTTVAVVPDPGVPPGINATS